MISLFPLESDVTLILLRGPKMHNTQDAIVGRRLQCVCLLSKFFNLLSRSTLGYSSAVNVKGSLLVPKSNRSLKPSRYVPKANCRIKAAYELIIVKVTNMLTAVF